MATYDVIKNGSFQTPGSGTPAQDWYGTDIEINLESVYNSGHSTTNRVVEMDGASGQISVLMQNIHVEHEQHNVKVDFNLALRSNTNHSTDGVRVEIVDPVSNTVLYSTSITVSGANPPLTTTLSPYALDVPHLAAGNYVLRFTELGNNNSYGILLDDVSMMLSDTGTGPVPCFAAGTLIRTASGDRKVEELCPGDLVETSDNGLRPLRWVGSRRILAAELEANPHLWPIRIHAGALGLNTPARDLVLSPQHRVLVRSRVAERMFGQAEVLVAAKHLLDLPGVEVAKDLTEVTYYHVMFERHEVLISEGALSESFFTGTQAMKAIGPEAAEEIFRILPQLRTAGVLPVPARPLVAGRQGRRMISRHLAQGRHGLQAAV